MKLADGLAWFGAAAALAATLALGSGGWDREEVAAAATLGLVAAGILILIYRDRLVDWWYGIARDEIRAATVQDVEAIHSLATEYFGDSVTSKSQIKSLVYRHKTMFWVLQNKSLGKTVYQIDGYVCLFPMTEEMVASVESYSFTVADLVPPKLPKRRSDVAAIYVGAIVGKRYRARAKILGFIETKARQAASRSKTKTLYAKAATQQGLRLLVNNEFQPVKAGLTGLNTFYKKSAE